MPEILTPDMCVIGGGVGGAAVLGNMGIGARTVLIERNRTGGRIVSPTSARPPSTERFAARGVRVLTGHAAFKDRRTVSVGDIDIRARHFVIAAGTVPAVPSLSGLEHSPYFTTDTILGLDELPQRLIILAAEPCALELAQAYRRRGSDVTVLEIAPSLADHDPEAAAIVRTALERDGVKFLTSPAITNVACGVGATTVTLASGETIDGTHLLVTGRKPATEGLNLEAAGIAFDASGIRVNRKLKTKNGRVYAIGDIVAGHMHSSAAATYHAGLVVRHALLRQSVRADSSKVPRVLHTAPEIAEIGLTEAQARDRRLKVRLLRWPYHDNDRAQAERQTSGHIKVITTTEGRIVGAMIVGAQARELISMWTLAIAHGMNVADIVDVVMPYPALADIGKRAAMEYFTPGLTVSWLRRIIARLRVFG